MKNLIQYNYGISNLFFMYLNGDISKVELIESLKRVERRHKAEVGITGEFIFKFSDDDTLSTTINDLDRDLDNAKNRDFTMERMKDAISLNGELLIYYSLNELF